MMQTFKSVTNTFRDLPFMKRKHAVALKEMIAGLDAGADAFLEVGFAHGKSSAYIAAILEDRGAVI